MGIVWPDIPVHWFDLEPGPGAWTNATEAPPYPSRVSLWSVAAVQYRLIIGNFIIAGPYVHDPALQPPPVLSLPSSAVLQLRNGAVVGGTISALISQDIATTRPTGVA